MSKSKPPQDPNTSNVVIPPSRLASKQTQRLLDQLVAANHARKHSEQEQLIALRPLIMCGIPLRQLKEPYYVRQSGPYTVELISSPLLGTLRTRPPYPHLPRHALYGPRLPRR
jgi:hypothetical protein